MNFYDRLNRTSSCMNLYDRITLDEREEVAKLDGKKGHWVTMNGRHIFIDGETGEPLQKIPGLTVPSETKNAQGDENGSASDLKGVGDTIRNKSEMNVATVSEKKLYAFAQEMFAKAGTTPEAVIPNFRANLKALKEKMTLATDIKRIDMPVIEPKNMEKFKKDLERGAVDIYAPYAKEGLKKYGTNLPWERSDKPVAPKSKEAKKMIGMGLPKNDHGPRNDDIVKGSYGATSTSKLKPVQGEIWFTKVIGNLMSFGVPKQGGKLTDDAPIIVSKDGYILDGHHRFGQAMLADPSLKLKSLTLPLDVKTLVKVARTYGTAVGNKAKD